MIEIQSLVLVAAAFAGLVIAGMMVLKARQARKHVTRSAIERPASAEGVASPATRIMLADLKERVRRLERIADGVE